MTTKPRPHKPRAAKLTRDELAEMRAHLDTPLARPRPWLKDCNRDPRLAAILRAQAERATLCR